MFRESLTFLVLSLVTLTGVVRLTGQELAGQAAEPAVADGCRLPQLRQELLKRMKQDQEARFALLDWMKQNQGAVPDPSKLPPEVIRKVTTIDQTNREWLEKVIEHHGWPTRELVGEEGAHAAWLLVQHADVDPEFQAACLKRMKACEKGQVAGVDIAYLEDRVRLAQGQPQVYGTQVELRDGEWQVRDVVEPDQLDARRAEVGLPPIAEYLQRVRELQGTPAKSTKESDK